MGEAEARFVGKHVLITGGLGFIGSNLARALVFEGAAVTLIDSLVPEYGGSRFNVHDIEPKLTINISDVRDRYSLASLIANQDVLFNLAGQTSHLDSMENPFTDLEINSRAQLSILETCKQINRDLKIVFASTRQIYGRPTYLPVDEQHPVVPVDVNGINKMAGEWYHTLYGSVYGIPVSVLRLTNTYGPGMRIKDSRQTFLGVWIRSLLEGRPIEVWEGEQLRDLNYVDDVVEAFLKVSLSSEADGKVFNLGADPPIKLIELAKLLVEANGGGSYEVRRFPENRKRIDIGDYYSNFDSIRSLLHWAPRVSLDQGLRKTLSYYRRFLNNYV